MKRISFLWLPVMSLVAILGIIACAPPPAGTVNATPVISISTPAATGVTGGLPKLAKKEKYRVGFAQTENDNPWRRAQTASMQAEAAKRGFELVYTDAGGSTSKQLADVDSMIAQKVDAIFLSPREEGPLAPAILKAQAAGIPVILLDRNVNRTLAQAGRNYVTFIGSDFVQEGKRAADWLIQATGGNAKIIELEDTAGSSVANDRKKGFDGEIKRVAGMQILASQPADASRETARQLMTTLLQSHPEVTAVFAHTDEMALGAIAALEAAGRRPGQDVLVVSIDGEKDALQAIMDGKLGASVECNPRFGPKAFDTLIRYANGDAIPTQIINPDNFYDTANAPQAIANAY